MIKIKQLEWTLDKNRILHADYAWQYYTEDGTGYGDLLAGYFIVLSDNMSILYYGDAEIELGQGTLDECKATAQTHLEHILRYFIEDKL